MDRLYKSFLFIGLCALLIFSPIARGAVRIWSATPVELVAYSMIFLWLLKVANGKGAAPLRGGPLTAPIALFAILAASSFAFSIYKHDSFYSLIRLFAYIGLYYVIANEFSRRMRKNVILLVISVGGIISAYGLLQYFGVSGKSWWYPNEYLAATYVNHNHFAGYLELIIPVAATVLIANANDSSIFYKLALTIFLVFMGAAFILTQSRGAWISIGLSFLIATLCIARKGPKAPAKLLIAVMVLVSLASLAYFAKDIIFSRLSTVTDIRSGEDPSGGRLKIWQGALGMVKDRPLTGVGIGDFDRGFYRYRPSGFNVRAVYAHNDYLQAAAEMGIFAPFIMIWIFFLAVRAGLENEADPYALGCAIGVLSLALHGVMDFNFHIPSNMLLFTVWIAIIMGERDIPDVKRT